MKLLLLALLAIALVHCQHPYYAYYYPRVTNNPFVYYNQMPSYRSLPYNWQLRYFDANQNNGAENILVNDDNPYELLSDDILRPAGQHPAQFRTNALYSTSQQQDSPVARFFFNQGNNNIITSSSTQSLAFALKTLVHTTVSTRTVITTALCIPASLIGYASSCSRRRRDIESIRMPVEPSPTETLETTALEAPQLSHYANDQPATPAIASSKANGDGELEESAAASLGRAKRFFIARTTLTSYAFATTTLKRPVNILARIVGDVGPCTPGPGVNGGVNCLLSCIPPGYIVC